MQRAVRRDRAGKGISFREQERHGKAQTPIRIVVRAHHIVPIADLETDGLLTDLNQLRDIEIQRHRPLLRLPVVGRLRVHAERRARLCAVGKERL
jgi:hypothetical protein